MASSQKIHLQDTIIQIITITTMQTKKNQQTRLVARRQNHRHQVSMSAKSRPSKLNNRRMRRKVSARKRQFPKMQPIITHQRLPLTPNASNPYIQRISRSKIIVCRASSEKLCASWPAALEMVSTIMKSFGTPMTQARKVICSIAQRKFSADSASTLTVVTVDSRTYKPSFEINSIRAMLQPLKTRCGSPTTGSCASF